jgi:hypothetical protein
MPGHSFGVDSTERLGREYLLNCTARLVSSCHVVTRRRSGENDISVILGANGGASGVHEHSMLLCDAGCFVAVGSCLVQLTLPTLALAWCKEVDSATCFGVYASSDRQALISHGELELARVSFGGEIIWTAGGADIFSEGVEIADGRITTVDFEGRRYVFDEYTGREIR